MNDDSGYVDQVRIDNISIAVFNGLQVTSLGLKLCWTPNAGLLYYCINPSNCSNQNQDSDFG